jgi:CMP-N-acetylneuraminic acid synthetase
LNVVGVIPARSGSQRVRDKNIARVGGYPLIYYTIREALKAKTLSRVIVSTDSQYYAEIAHNHGAEVPFLRPPEISGDVDTTLVLKHCIWYLENRGYPVDVVVCLQPTSPLRKAWDIDACVNKLLETGCDSVVSVREITEPPQWMFRLEEDRMVPFTDVDTARLGGMIFQDLPKLYMPNGAVYCARRNVVMNENRIYGRDCRAYVMPPERSLDIETPEDLRLAEIMLEGDRHGRPVHMGGGQEDRRRARGGLEKI